MNSQCVEPRASVQEANVGSSVDLLALRRSSTAGWNRHKTLEYVCGVRRTLFQVGFVKPSSNHRNTTVDNKGMEAPYYAALRLLHMCTDIVYGKCRCVG